MILENLTPPILAAQLPEHLVEPNLNDLHD
jgi:hypothetical protein